MRTISYKLCDLNKARLAIGYVGENEHTQVRIDCAEIFAEYPQAEATMVILPPSGSAYPKTVTTDGTTVIWTVTDSDLAAEGEGELQITFTENSVIVKSVVSRYRVTRSIIGSGDAPDPVQDWVDDANDLLADLEEKRDTDYWKGDPGEPGQDGAPGRDGQDGHTPVKGTDYWTAEDKAEIVSDVEGAIIDDTAGDGDTSKTWSADKLHDEFASVSNDITKEKDKTDDTIALSANLINTDDDDFLDGYYISGGAVWQNALYNATGYILMEPGNKIIISNDGNPALAEFLGVFTAKDLTSYALQVKNVYSYTNVYNFNIYVRISYQKANTKYQIQYGDVITSYAPYGDYYVIGLPDVQRNTRTKIDIVSNGDITAFDAEMQRALSIGNCDVYIHRGTYEFTNAFVESLFARTSRCIPIGNGCRYFFETGAKITAKYTGAVNNYWHAFGADPNVRGSYELHNLNLDAANICYGIHDEYLGYRDHYRNVYDHCRIIVDNTGRTTSDTGDNKCIGGGLGGNAEIIIDGCYFDSVTCPTQDVSYHGKSSINLGDNANIIVKDSWFKHTLALGDASIESSSEEKNVIFCGNSISSDIYFPGGSTDEEKWTVTKWNNEIRT